MSANNVNFGWINLLKEANPELANDLGVDLNQNGTVESNETADTNGDHQVSQDEARQYCIDNQQALKDLIPLIKFALGSGFSLSNPIHNTIVREYSFTRKPTKIDDIRKVYENLRTIGMEYADILESHASEDGVLEVSPNQLMEWMSDAMITGGAHFASSGSQLFIEDAKMGMYDCDTSTRVVLGMAYEFGLPIHAVAVPGHVFARWEFEDGKHINFEVQQGAEDEYGTHFLPDSFYIDWKKIDNESIYNGTYLQSMTTEEFENWDFYNIIYTHLSQFTSTNGVHINTEDLTTLSLQDIQNIDKSQIDIKNIDKVIEVIEDALLPVAPDFAMGHALLALAYTIRGHYNGDEASYHKAIEHHSRVIDLIPSNLAALVNRSELYEETGDYQAALDDLDVLISKAPLPEFYQKRGNILIELGYLEAAHSDLMRAEALAQQNHGSSVSGESTLSATVETGGSSFEDAVNIYDMIEDGTMSHLERSEAYMLLGDYESAKAALLEALKENPDDANTLTALADIELSMGRWNSAIEYANQSIDKDEMPDKPYAIRAEAYIEMARENIENGSSLEAQHELYQKAVEDLGSIFSPTAQSITLTGIAHEALGNIEEARQAFIKALEIEPDNADALTQLALLEAKHGDFAHPETGDLGRGYNSAYRAKALDPNNSDAILACALISNRTGYFEEALRLSEVLMTFDQNDEEANAAHAQAAIKLAEKTLETADSDEDYVMAFNYYSKAMTDLTFLYSRTNDPEIAVQIHGLMTRVAQLGTPQTTQVA